MQSSLHSKKPTTAQVAAVSFGFFNDDEVRGRTRQAAGPANWRHEGLARLLAASASCAQLASKAATARPVCQHARCLPACPAAGAQDQLQADCEPHHL